MKTRSDKVAIGVIWLLVVSGALVVGRNSSDPGGVGELAAVIGLAVTGVYWYLRRLRTSGRFVQVNEKRLERRRPPG